MTTKRQQQQDSNNSKRYPEKIQLTLDSEILDHCEYEDCERTVTELLFRIRLKRDMLGNVTQHEVKKWHVCSEHYVVLTVNMAGSATKGQIFG
jgi:hypothetical protein